MQMNAFSRTLFMLLMSVIALSAAGQQRQSGTQQGAGAIGTVPEPFQVFHTPYPRTNVSVAYKVADWPRMAPSDGAGGRFSCCDRPVR
jgi:hypothetical protein